MSVHWLPRGGTAAPTTEPAEGSARVYVLDAARRARAARIPASALDEVRAAARLRAELEAEGLRVRFDADAPDGRVAAHLTDAGDDVVNVISLTDLVHGRVEPDPAA